MKAIKRMIPILLSAALLAGGASGFQLSVHALENSNAEETESISEGSLEDSPEWVAELDAAEDAQQLFVVAGVGATTAYISMHEKDEEGVWKQIMTTPGFIGKKGLYKEKEGDAKTPVGTFSFNYAFGIAPDPGCAIEYHQVTEDDYWSGDQREGYGYNEMVSILDLPDLDVDESEHITDYTYEYQYCLNISYNEEGKPGLGSAIFLHCLGAMKPYTGGCVAIPKDQMLKVMQNVREDCVVVIDSLETLSPALWEKLGLGASVTPEKETYESSDGWQVQYDPDEIGVNETDDEVSFVYIGESAGTNMLTIRYIADKQPEEVLYELTESWGEQDQIRRTEGFFPGTTDKWAYWRIFEPAAEETAETAVENDNDSEPETAETGEPAGEYVPGSGLGMTAIAGEYNGGVLVFEYTTHMSGTDAVDMRVSDALSELMNSIKYTDFTSQPMYDYYPGVYVRTETEEIEGEETTAERTVELFEDHTGVITLQDSINVLWGSIELMAASGGSSYEFTIEGDNLYLNLDGEWLEFTRQEVEETEPEEAAKTEPEAEETEQEAEETEPEEPVITGGFPWTDTDLKANVS